MKLLCFCYARSNRRLNLRTASQRNKSYVQNAKQPHLQTSLSVAGEATSPRADIAWKNGLLELSPMCEPTADCRLVTLSPNPSNQERVMTLDVLGMYSVLEERKVMALTAPRG